MYAVASVGGERDTKRARKIAVDGGRWWFESKWQKGLAGGDRATEARLAPGAGRHHREMPDTARAGR